MNERDVLKRKLEEVEKRAQLLEEDIALTASVKRSVPDLDETIKSQFYDLRSDIRSFARDYCNDTMPAASLPEHVRALFAQVSAVASNRLLRSKLHAGNFIEGLIWRKLPVDFLLNPFCLWGREFASVITEVLGNCSAKYLFFG